MEESSRQLWVHLEEDSLPNLNHHGRRSDNAEMATMLGRGYSATQWYGNNNDKDDCYQVTVRHGDEEFHPCLRKDISKV